MGITREIEAVFLGRSLGYCSGIEQVDDFIFCCWDFVPGHGIQLPHGTLTVVLDEGRFEVYDGDEVSFSEDIISFMAELPRNAPSFFIEEEE